MTAEVRELREAEYPPRLRDLPKPPDRFWVAGELPRGPSVAIVGTRYPSERGRQFAHELARDLARAGVSVFSGGALGIDRAAHEGALDGGGVTAVVAPSAFDRPYPADHAELFDRVLRTGGAFATSFEPGTVARPHRFFLRNGQLAALTQALVVVETRLIGGSRNAVSWARRLGRPVLAVPGAPWMTASAGCLLEIQRGASLVASSRDVLAAIGLARLRAPSSSRPTSGPASARAPHSSPDPVRARLFSLLAAGPRYPDDLCAEAALPAAALQALLLTLTLEGIVVSDPSGRVVLVTS